MNPRTTTRARKALDRWVANAPAVRRLHNAGAWTAHEGQGNLNWQTKWVRPTVEELADAVVPGWDKETT